jgi:hypothetical protein
MSVRVRLCTGHMRTTAADPNMLPKPHMAASWTRSTRHDPTRSNRTTRVGRFQTDCTVLSTPTKKAGNVSLKLGTVGELRDSDRHSRLMDNHLLK